jgi:hypothetical protein
MDALPLPLAFFLLLLSGWGLGVGEANLPADHGDGVGEQRPARYSGSTKVYMGPPCADQAGTLA